MNKGSTEQSATFVNSCGYVMLILVLESSLTGINFKCIFFFFTNEFVMLFSDLFLLLPLSGLNKQKLVSF